MYVYIKTQFEGFHRWPEAPAEVKFLRDLHRHIFQVKLAVPVTHSERDVEFILFKRKVDEFISKTLNELNTDAWSCEKWCEILMEEFKASSVDVSEDGENGAIWKEPEPIKILVDEGLIEIIKSLLRDEQRPGGLLHKGIL
jgi:hypothetical protein